MIVPETQRYMAERMKAEMKAHAVDHAPSVTAPTAVVDIIRDAIHSVTGSGSRPLQAQAAGYRSFPQDNSFNVMH